MLPAIAIIAIFCGSLWHYITWNASLTLHTTYQSTVAPRVVIVQPRPGQSWSMLACAKSCMWPSTGHGSIRWIPVLQASDHWCKQRKDNCSCVDVHLCFLFYRCTVKDSTGTKQCPQWPSLSELIESHIQSVILFLQAFLGMSGTNSGGGARLQLAQSSLDLDLSLLKMTLMVSLFGGILHFLTQRYLDR